MRTQEDNRKATRISFSFFTLAVAAIILLSLSTVSSGSVRVKRQSGGSGNGEVLTSIFQIPIQTLQAVHDLLQSTRTRVVQLQAAYAQAQMQHPNHRPNPHFVNNRNRPHGRSETQKNT